jgi:hypothetical protein
MKDISELPDTNDDDESKDKELLSTDDLLIRYALKALEQEKKKEEKNPFNLWGLI